MLCVSLCTTSSCSFVLDQNKEKKDIKTSITISLHCWNKQRGTIIASSVLGRLHKPVHGQIQLRPCNHQVKRGKDYTK